VLKGRDLGGRAYDRVMAEPKTRPTDASVDDYLSAIADAGRRADAETVAALMREVTGEPAVMWGTTIVGFGALTYQGSRTTRSWPVVAFAPRAKELVLYLNTELEAGLFEALGRHRRGVGCLYIRTLSDVDPVVLRSLVERSTALARG